MIIDPDIEKSIRKQIEWEKKFGRVRPIISINENGITFIAVGNKLFFNNGWQTFPDFLEDYLRITFGPTWWKEECAKEPGTRHIVIDWAYKMYEFKKSIQKREDGFYSAEPNGPMAAYIHIAYDLYILEHHLKLQKKLVDRMKYTDQFQGARYELFVAATLLRSNYDIEYPDETNRNEKHPDFIALSRRTGEKIFVEAKSRHRKGVLGQPGELIKSARADIGSLLKRAFDKNPAGPFVIFLDINLPPFIGEASEIHWLKQVINSVQKITRKPLYKTQDPFNLLIITNIPHHYGKLKDVDPKKYYVHSISPNPKFKIEERTLWEIAETVALYENIPNELPFPVS